MIIDYFKLTIENLKRKKLRSFLTILGIVISIMIIFVLISLSLGLENSIREQFEKLGTDKFFIMPRGQFGVSNQNVKFGLEDFNAVKKVKGVNRAAYFSIENSKISYKEKRIFKRVIGLPEESEEMNLIFESMGLDIEDGRFLKKNENKKVLLGSDYKYRKLLGKEIKVGEKISINEEEYEVAGILTSVGNSEDDSQVYISRRDFEEMFNSKSIDMIIVEVKLREDVKEVANRTEKILMRVRDVNEKTKDFEILTPEELISSFGSVLNIITAFLVGIASVSLLVGGVGIANTMYTSVLERTKDIGTMKAIGAKNKDILAIFVIESGLFGLIGGILGVLLGIGLVKIIDFVAINYINISILRSAIPIWLIFACISFAFLIGSISGFLPSLQASKLKPSESLRYE